MSEAKQTRRFRFWLWLIVNSLQDDVTSGVKPALGAQRSNILALVMRQGMLLTVLGVAIGLTGAFVATRAIVTLLFGISRLDPITYLGVIALLIGVSGIACWIPARRATKVDPMTALRHE